MNRPAGRCLAESSVIRVPDDDHAARKLTGSLKSDFAKTATKLRKHNRKINFKVSTQEVFKRRRVSASRLF